MTFNYRIIKRVNKENNYTYYALNEVFYKETGKPIAFSDADDVIGETPEEIIAVLKMMLKDAKKDQPILTEEDFKVKNDNT